MSRAARLAALPKIVQQRASYPGPWRDELERYLDGEVDLAEAYRALAAKVGHGGNVHDSFWVTTPDGPRPRIPLTQAETRRLFLLPTYARFAGRYCPAVRALLGPYVRGEVTLDAALERWRDELVADGATAAAWPAGTEARVEALKGMTEGVGAARWAWQRPGVVRA